MWTAALTCSVHSSYFILFALGEHITEENRVKGVQVSAIQPFSLTVPHGGSNSLLM